MTIRREDNKAIPLITSAQAVTGSWVDLGSVINVMDCRNIALWLKLTINSSNDVRLRLVGLKSELASDVYNVPILDVAASKVNVQPEFYELTNDSDQNLVLAFPVIDELPFCKFQVQAGTVGVPAASITEAAVSFQSNAQGAGRGV